MKRLVSVSLLVVVAVMAFAPGAALAQEADIVDTAVAAGNFTTLAAALEAADLIDVLKGEGPFTVFAPTDDAFAALPEGTLEALLQDIPTLTNILTYHVVQGALPASDVVSRSAVQMLNGAPALVKVDDMGAKINDANIVTTDIFTTNGVIHVIDAVMLPPEGDIVDTAVAAGDFTTLAAALEAAGLVDALKGEGPFTVFAPTDEAFAKLPEGTIDALLADIATLTDILTYHVAVGVYPAVEVVGRSSLGMLNGAPALINGAMIDDANIVTTDILTSNGIIHVIDAVILPPDGDIVDTALAAGSFNTLATALAQAGLVDMLKSEGPFTVFAPTDEAFAALGEETLSAVLADPALLTSILLYHVVPGVVPASDVVNAGSIKTAMGESLTVSVESGVKVDNANVVQTDILTRNGIIHVIDAVLLPPTPAEGERCAAVVNTGANLRAGPGTDFGRIGGRPQGAEVQVIAQNADGSWYELLLEDGGRAWIASVLLDNLACPDGFTLPSR